MPEMAKIFTEESCISNRKYTLMLTNLDHIWVIIGPCFGYFYNIFASRCIYWLKFSLESLACQIEEYSALYNYLYHILAMFWPYQGHILAISKIFLLPDALSLTFYCKVVHAK